MLPLRYLYVTFRSFIRDIYNLLMPYNILHAIESIECDFQTIIIAFILSNFLLHRMSKDRIDVCHINVFRPNPYTSILPFTQIIRLNRARLINW